MLLTEMMATSLMEMGAVVHELSNQDTDDMVEPPLALTRDILSEEMGT